MEVRTRVMVLVLVWINEKWLVDWLTGGRCGRLDVGLADCSLGHSQVGRERSVACKCSKLDRLKARRALHEREANVGRGRTR